jgi:hypothetical protein
MSKFRIFSTCENAEGTDKKKTNVRFMLINKKRKNRNGKQKR